MITSSTSSGKASKICLMIGLPRISSRGLGLSAVRGIMRLPLPAARITAFIDIYYREDFASEEGPGARRRCARKESNLRPLSYQDSVLPLNYARANTAFTI